jgi:hypothetical protein
VLIDRAYRSITYSILDAEKEKRVADASKLWHTLTQLSTTQKGRFATGLLSGYAETFFQGLMGLAFDRQNRLYSKHFPHA